MTSFACNFPMIISLVPSTYYCGCCYPHIYQYLLLAHMTLCICMLPSDKYPCKISIDFYRCVCIYNPVRWWSTMLRMVCSWWQFARAQGDDRGTEGGAVDTAVPGQTQCRYWCTAITSLVPSAHNLLDSRSITTKQAMLGVWDFNPTPLLYMM